MRHLAWKNKVAFYIHEADSLQGIISGSFCISIQSVFIH